MKKKNNVWIPIAIAVLVLFVDSFFLIEASITGEAKKIPSILNPRCSDLISPAGSFVLSSEWGKEQIMGNPGTILDELDEDSESLNNACGGVYYLRSCSSLQNSAAKYLNGEGKKGMPIVMVNIIHLTDEDKSALSLLIDQKYEKWEYSFFEGYDKTKPVWWWNNGLKQAWFSGDVFIDISGPLTLVDYSLIKSYYEKYPPTE